MKSKILYIDDEQFNLLAFKASFRRDYEVIPANSAKKAREILKDQDIDVIISDQKMPNETGIEFFEWVKSQYFPQCRFLLTGYVEADILDSAVKNGGIYFYITKPWLENEIRVMIEIGLKIKELRLLFKNEIKEFVEKYNHAEIPMFLTNHQGQVIARNIIADELLGPAMISYAKQNLFNLIEDEDAQLPFDNEELVLKLDRKNSLVSHISTQSYAEKGSEDLVVWQVNLQPTNVS